MQKKCGRYLRFSNEDQSANSTERQDIVTYNWCDRNQVEIAATFIDDGHSARTFDRPDVQKLFDFIKKNQQRIDYLVVQDLSRFSREAGEAITMVKQIQLKYGVRIVSCDWNQVYDVTEANSYFMMLIEFGRATAENLTKINYTNGGIYAAKTGIKGGKPTGEERGRYIGSSKPFGYEKIVEDKLCNIGVVESLRVVVEMIYTNYLADIPILTIKAEARKAGLKAGGKMVIQNIIQNPVYKGYQYVKPWKDNKGGLFRGSWEPIIDPITWQRANDKLKSNKAKGISLNEAYYLKNVLRCWCGRKATAAPSKGKTKYYPYYKCNCSRHLNVNADFAHRQLNETMRYLSLPDYLVESIKETSLAKMEMALKENKKLISKYKMDLADSKEKLVRVEAKFIADQISPDTYNRWYTQYSADITELKYKIDNIDKSDEQLFLLVNKNIEYLTDIPYAFENFTIVQKQSFLNTVFDNSLYMQDKIYRTPYLMDIFHHNKLILKQKQLLLVEEKTGFREEARSGVPHRSIIEHRSPSLYSLLVLFDSIKVAG